MPRPVFRTLSPPRLALALAAAGLAAACGAGRIRDEIGRQIREVGDRLRNAPARERYADELRGQGDAGAALARAWDAAGDRALGAPAAAPLPLREQGAFSGAAAAALAWRVRPRRGERVTVRVDAAADSGARLFTELWREQGSDPGARRLVASGDGLHAAYNVLADDAGAAYVVRVQPELRRNVRWAVAFGVGPSLAFPVQGKDVRAVASGFGAERDGGARSHEGVDIMAPRGTPALAAEDGVVRYVGDDRLGGRVVSVDAPERGHSLYYAHLDRQAVRDGQAVRTGDTVGFVGNTGNASGGPTHLHFGIYTGDGAVDPMPYLDDRRRIASAPGRDTALVGRTVRSAARGAIPLRAGPGAATSTLALVAPRTALAVDGAAGGGWLRVEVPDAGGAPMMGYVPATAVERVVEPHATAGATTSGSAAAGH
ncbi:hypothetical protein tb265_30400 [Gemmatimonadetes bacterium T265]|nr:hypothetical protein tb265_30400 [Gemmatimonadetes bacterium T265]